MRKMKLLGGFLLIHQLGRLEASMRDYEMLQKEAPEDEEVRKALMEVESKLRKQ